MQAAVAAVESNSTSLPKTDNAAEMIGGTGAVFEHGQNLHRVRRANRPANTALRIDARSQVGMSLGQHPDRFRDPAKQCLMHDAERQSVEAG